jgi:sugar lactone lactonase YvrE/ketosteroid isomerase-like protein
LSFQRRRNPYGVCYPDRLVSPGNDPSCNDAVWEALFATPEPPAVTRTGISYMLAGGSDESNTDPMATGPAAGEEWISTPPHLMLLTPGGFDADSFTTEHGSGYPYIMWDDTPYEHLMIPVADMPEMAMSGMESTAAEDMESLKAEVIALEFATFDHLRAHDVEAVRAETSEDFIVINADGSRGGLEDYVATVADPDLSFDEPVRSEPETIVISPDAVLVIYTLETSGTFKGEPFANHEHLSSLWQKRDGKWLNTFLQVSPVAAAQEGDADTGQAETVTTDMPTSVMLPNGFQPEGIAIGKDATAYVGSVGSGAIYKVDLATGEGSFLVEPQATQKVLGLVHDQRTDLLFVAGGAAGNGLVYDGATGEVYERVQFTTDPDAFINDVALADDAVFFTDSNLPLVYRLPLEPESHLCDLTAIQTITLTGDFEHVPGGINGNGIVASPDGTKLIVAHTDLGKLYTVDTATGVATELALDGETELYHDGLVLDGDTLYVVNYNDRVYVVELDPDWASGKLVRTITDPQLEAPATAAIYGDALYVVNARWDAEQTPETEFWLTRVTR